MRINFKRYGAYLVRWQLSTPILAPIMAALSEWNAWLSASVANLVGGLIFFWVDSYIFRAKALRAHWEVEEDVACADCGRVSRGYRLVRTGNYDKSKSENVEFRCETCSQAKTEELRQKGVAV